MYDYLIVGAGFFGATFARLMTDAGYKCLVIESRSHVAGNAYTKKIEGIDVHMYGPHIFHTNDDKIWNFVNRFGKFNNYINRPKAIAQNEKMYSLPFNMNTFYQLWGIKEPARALKKIEEQRLKLDRPAANLEEQALSLVGTDIYNLLIKGYTEKQWQCRAKDLPAFIINRLPLRFTFDDNYFNDRYQGIPEEGYTKLIKNMLDSIDVELGVNYFDDREKWNSKAKRIVFTGKIDEFFDYQFGDLEYRTLDFETTTLDIESFQGTAVINYTDPHIPWTRIIEHKFFNPTKTSKTVITKEIPAQWARDKVPYYPINNEKNSSLLAKYQELAEKTNVIFGGRLAEYKYYDMHQVIGSAMKIVKGLNK